VFYVNFKSKRGKPEKEGALRLIHEMERHNWTVHRLNVSAGTYSTPGFPDYYATHKFHGTRWIETKTERGTLSTSQIERFTKFAKDGVGVWVLSDEQDYEKLFLEANWGKFLWRP
jgi:hypothetical protein